MPKCPPLATTLAPRTRPPVVAEKTVAVADPSAAGAGPATPAQRHRLPAPPPSEMTITAGGGKTITTAEGTTGAPPPGIPPGEAQRHRPHRQTANHLPMKLPQQLWAPLRLLPLLRS